jgi:hypothetical protein
MLVGNELGARIAFSKERKIVVELALLHVDGRYMDLFSRRF